jgi:serine/threonine protein kinase
MSSKSKIENYEMLKILGEGSFGKVYLMKQKATKQLCCIKLIKLTNIPKKEREACKAEVFLLRKLNHPNIVTYIDAFNTKSNGSLAIVMEFCDGGDLSGIIDKAKKTRTLFSGK